MSTTNWRELYEEKDKDGSKVLDVAFWSDGTPASYRYKSASDCGGITIACYMLIPRKPAPVVVPWEPDEVPVGAVVRRKSNPYQYGVILDRTDADKFWAVSSWITCQELFDLCVLHQPGIPTEQCQPCGKVVKS